MTAWFVACVFCVAGLEGGREVAYRDPVGIPTYCFGETQHPSGRPVQIGDTAAPGECEERLKKRIAEFGARVDKCVDKPLPAARKAAYTSLAYNIGPSAFCNSTLVKLERAGKPREACDQILKWDKARGIALPGLTKRRQLERDLCSQSL